MCFEVVTMCNRDEFGDLLQVLISYEIVVLYILHLQQYPNSCVHMLVFRYLRGNDFRDFADLSQLAILRDVHTLYVIHAWSVLARI